MPALKITLGPENTDAEKFLPPTRDDGSGVGINYADAYIKPMKVIMEDGRKILAKRRGLKLTVSIGDRSGEAILRRLEFGPDQKTIVQQALHEAVRNAGANLCVENGVMMLELDER